MCGCTGWWAICRLGAHRATSGGHGTGVGRLRDLRRANGSPRQQNLLNRCNMSAKSGDATLFARRLLLQGWVDGHEESRQDREGGPAMIAFSGLYMLGVGSQLRGKAGAVCSRPISHVPAVGSRHA